MYVLVGTARLDGGWTRPRGGYNLKLLRAQCFSQCALSKNSFSVYVALTYVHSRAYRRTLLTGFFGLARQKKANSPLTSGGLLSRSRDTQSNFWPAAPDFLVGLLGCVLCAAEVGWHTLHLELDPPPRTQIHMRCAHRPLRPAAMRRSSTRHPPRQNPSAGSARAASS